MPPAELLPHCLEPVGGTEGDRAPALLGQQGRGVAAGGGGIASARVEVSAGVNAGRNVTTGSDGRYTMNDLSAGELTLQASAAGYTTQTTSLTIGANQTVDFNLPAAPPSVDRATVSGVVSFPSPVWNTNRLLFLPPTSVSLPRPPVSVALLPSPQR